MVRVVLEGEARNLTERMVAMDIYQYSASFDPASGTITIRRVFPLPVLPPDLSFPLTVASGISSIIFTLDPASGARFPSSPIQWYSGSEPAASPPWFEFHSFDSWSFSLWDFNSAPGPDSMPHNFRLYVYYDEKLYWTDDPTIVNDPPMGPPPDDGD
jgi:hypothetical protein